MDPESKYVGVFEFDSPLLVIRDLDLIKSITMKNFDHFPNHRMTFDPDLEPLFSNNLFSTTEDMIQLMLETRGKLGSGKELTIDDMTAQALIFFFAGFEGTSTLMCFTAYEVGINDQVQKRLQEEIDQVLEDCKGQVTYEAINGMKYLEAVILESFRMYPAAIGSDRETVRIAATRAGSKAYSEPKKFNPDRFYDNSKQLSNSLPFLTFGVGPRMCIGNRFALLETKVLLFYIFAKCNLAPCAKSSIPLKLYARGLTMIPENGFWLKIQPRMQRKRSPRRFPSQRRPHSSRKFPTDIWTISGLDNSSWQQR
ncbi:hypothetical protein E2986_13917 [Frieseomelitta varia]|uniref:Cytochrome P450 n=1 Tax=Frieseomelitta varia TaxID=561572 RepID=A0A833W1F9_9HYME|nr:hypothetical protein E2986_13917 [Frieseomelitta varia]